MRINIDILEKALASKSLKERLQEMGDPEKIKREADEIPNDLLDLLGFEMFPNLSQDENLDVEADSPADELVKAYGHKYLSRYRDQRGKWRYVYAQSRTGKGSASRHDSSAKVDASKLTEGLEIGSSFSAGAGQGHWHVQGIRDGKVTYKDDETGFVNILPVADFKKRITDAHKGMIEAHAQDGLRMRETILEAAKKHGSDKQVARAEKLLAEWKQKHKDHIPTSKGGGKIDVKLAELKGSEKQVKWAEDIRERFMKQAKGLDGAWFKEAIEKTKKALSENNDPRFQLRAQATLDHLKDMETASPKILQALSGAESAKSWIDARNALAPSSPEAAIRALDGFFGHGVGSDIAVLFGSIQGAQSPDAAKSAKSFRLKASENETVSKLLQASQIFHEKGNAAPLEILFRQSREKYKQAMVLTGKGDAGAALKVLLGDSASKYQGEATTTRLMQELSATRGAMLLAHPDPSMHSVGKALLKRK